MVTMVRQLAALKVWPQLMAGCWKCVSENWPEFMKLNWKRLGNPVKRRARHYWNVSKSQNHIILSSVKVCKKLLWPFRNTWMNTSYPPSSRASGTQLIFSVGSAGLTTAWMHWSIMSATNILDLCITPPNTKMKLKHSPLILKGKGAIKVTSSTEILVKLNLCLTTLNFCGIVLISYKSDFQQAWLSLIFQPLLNLYNLASIWTLYEFLNSKSKIHILYKLLTWSSTGYLKRKKNVVSFSHFISLGLTFSLSLHLWVVRSKDSLYTFIHKSQLHEGHQKY